MINGRAMVVHVSIEAIDAAKGDTITKWAEAIADRQSSRLPPSSVHPSTPTVENSVQLSPAAELLAKIEMLAQTDPTRFKEMASQVANQIQASTSNAPSGAPQNSYSDPHAEARVQAILNAVMDQIYAAISRTL